MEGIAKASFNIHNTNACTHRSIHMMNESEFWTFMFTATILAFFLELVGLI